MVKFEGPEKKLEIILSSPRAGLRQNTNGQWSRVVKASRAEILNRISSCALDAYLLSESSLFVWDDRILLITCGTTTPVMAVPKILEILPPEAVAHLFYERKNNNYPQDQPTCFDQDAEFLQAFFPGSIDCLGPTDSDHLHVYHASRSAAQAGEDQTLQVLMHDLDPRVLSAFSGFDGSNAFQAQTLKRLYGIFPSMMVDSHFFEPHGYSANGISGTSYFTVHVTPQVENSYASFETNVQGHDANRTIRESLATFRPKRFTVVLTTRVTPSGLLCHEALDPKPDGYRNSGKASWESDGQFKTTYLNFAED